MYGHLKFLCVLCDIFWPGPEVIKHFSCSTQLSMKYFLLMKYVLLISLKLQTIANCFLLNIAEEETFSADRYKNANCGWRSHIY